MSWLGADSNFEVNQVDAYSVGPLKGYHQQNPRDILIKFPDWHLKSVVVDSFLPEKPNFFIDNSRIALLPDLSIITLSKRRNFRFFFNLSITTRRDTLSVGFSI